MARSCALCGKTSMGGFNSQSSGMNKVRTHRRYSVNLHPYKIPQGNTLVTAKVCTRCVRRARKTA